MKKKDSVYMRKVHAFIPIVRFLVLLHSILLLLHCLKGMNAKKRLNDSNGSVSVTCQGLAKLAKKAKNNTHLSPHPPSTVVCRNKCEFFKVNCKKK